MATTTNFKDIIDLPDWRPLAPAPNASATAVCIAEDKRNNDDRHPEIFQLVSAIVFNSYNVKNDGWSPYASPALTGTFGAGAAMVVDPSKGPSGTVGAGCTTTSIVITTAFPGAVGVNQCANRGDGRGYKIRIKGSAAGSSGKTEERLIVGNTSGTTPTLTLDSALTFTPANGDGYEIFSGRVYLLSAGTLAVGSHRYYDILTNTYTSVSITNLPASITTDSSFIHLCELYVPNTKNPGDGIYGNLVATGSAATTLTGQATGGDAGVAVNEFRNFRVRIVTDTAIPTAVGQTRKIVSHTAGASAVYTVATWTVTPSTTATFVIENSDETLLWTTASTTTYTYDGDADTWSTTTYAVRPAAMAAGCMSFQSIGLTLDADKRARHSNVFSFRGGAVSTLDLLDIAGAATGSWTGGINYGSSGETFTTGSSISYDACTMGGRYAYINRNGLQTFYRLDCLNLELEQWAYLRYSQGTVVLGNKLAHTVFIDGATKISFLLALRSSGTEFFSNLISR